MAFLALLIAPTLAQLFLAPAAAPAAAPSAATVDAFPILDMSMPEQPLPPAEPESGSFAPACFFGVALGAAALMRPRSRPLSMMAGEETNVTKQALVDAVAKKAGVSKDTAAEVLTATLDVIVDSVSEGSKVSLIGFGTFRPKDRPAREARNPKTGEMIKVEAKTVPTFKFGSKFLDAVKNGTKM